MTDSLAAELEALAEKATPGPWAWTAEDESLLSLSGPRGEEDCVLAVAACEACVERAKKEPGYAERGEHCLWPKKANSELIVLLRNNAALLCAALRLSTAYDARMRNTEQMDLITPDDDERRRKWDEFRERHTALYDAELKALAAYRAASGGGA